MKDRMMGIQQKLSTAHDRENRSARIHRVAGFEASAAVALAAEVEAWMQDAGEKVIVSISWVASEGVGEYGSGGGGDFVAQYACFIVYTE